MIRMITKAGLAGMVALMGSSVFALPGKPAVGHSAPPSGASLVQKAHEGFFTRNSGQWNPKGLYLAQTRGVNYWVTSTGALLDFHRTVHYKHKRIVKSDAVEISIVGAHSPQTIGVAQRPVKTDYLIGGAKKPIHVDTFDEVASRNVLPGVTMRHYFDHAQPRYDLIVDSGRDASKIRMNIKGAESLSLSPSGSLKLKTSVGDVEERGLKVFTVKNGKQTPVAAQFHIYGRDQVGFDLGTYDRSQKLVIDPLIYGSYFGGEDGADCIEAVVSRADGGTYITGWTMSADFPVLQGASQTSLVGSRAAFVCLFRGDAYVIQYSSFISGNGSDEGRFIRLSNDGTQVWIAGLTTSTNLPLINVNSFQQSISGAKKTAFLMQFLVDSTQFLIPNYATYFGPDNATSSDVFTLRGFQIAPSTASVPGQLLLAGETDTPILGDISSDLLGGVDIYLAGFSPDGTTPQSHRYFGGTQDDVLYGLATDADGDFVIAGDVQDPGGNLDLSVNPLYFETTAGGWKNSQLLRSQDMFAAKIRQDMSTAWSGVVGGSGKDGSQDHRSLYDLTDETSHGTSRSLGNNSASLYDALPQGGVATDADGNVYFTGWAFSFDYPRTKNVIGEFNGVQKLVVTKLLADGSDFAYSTGLNAGNSVIARGIAVDGQGNATITGIVTNGSSFTDPSSTVLEPPNPDVPIGNTTNGYVATTADAIQSTLALPTSDIISTQDAFINVISPQADKLLYGTYIGGTGDEDIFAPYVDSFGDIWAFGVSDSFVGYVVPGHVPLAGGTIPASKVVQYATSLPSGFITNLAFKPSPNYPAGNGFSGSDRVISQYPYAYKYTEGNVRGLFYANQVLSRDVREDGFILRFRVGLPVISSFTLSKTVAPGGLGTTVTGVVTLSGAAPAEGANVIVTLANPTSAPNAATMVAGSSSSQVTVVIPFGSTTGTFKVQTAAVLAPAQVSLTADYSGNLAFNQLTVIPWLKGFSITPNQVNGGFTTQGTITLSDVAPSSGATVTVTPDITGVTGSDSFSVLVPSGLTTTSFNIPTNIVSTQQVVNLSAALLGFTRSASLTVNPVSIGVSSLKLSSSTVNAGQTVTGTITIDSPAPDSGLPVTVSLSDPTSATLSKTTVTILGGANQATFKITGGTVSLDTPITVTASFGTNTASAPLTVLAVTATVTLSPSSVVGGQGTTATVTLPVAASTSTLQVQVGSSDPSAQVPADSLLTFAQGSTTLTFPVTTSVVSSASTVAITAQVGTNAVTSANLTIRAIGLASITMTPGSIRPSQKATGRLTLDAPAAVDTTISITYGDGTPGSGDKFFMSHTDTVKVAAGSTTSTPITVQARRFSRPIKTTVSAKLGGKVVSTTITISR